MHGCLTGEAGPVPVSPCRKPGFPLQALEMFRGSCPHVHEFLVSGETDEPVRGETETENTCSRGAGLNDSPCCSLFMAEIIMHACGSRRIRSADDHPPSPAGRTRPGERCMKRHPVQLPLPASLHGKSGGGGARGILMPGGALHCPHVRRRKNRLQLFISHTVKNNNQYYIRNPKNQEKMSKKGQKQWNIQKCTSQDAQCAGMNSDLLILGKRIRAVF